jgi:hypothetical protein
VAGGGSSEVTVANIDSDFTYLCGGTGSDILTTGYGGGSLFAVSGAKILTGGGGTLNVFASIP